ncbi:hypothetical protein JTB14_005681 [Gonioctena quinquepunctata]|nr:hypothetical protein JTB14_005681 [Gonioctena quinquepunctata]
MKVFPVPSKVELFMTDEPSDFNGLGNGTFGSNGINLGKEIVGNICTNGSFWKSLNLLLLSHEYEIRNMGQKPAAEEERTTGVLSFRKLSRFPNVSKLEKRQAGAGSLTTVTYVRSPSVRDQNWSKNANRHMKDIQSKLWVP